MINFCCLNVSPLSSAIEGVLSSSCNNIFESIHELNMQWVYTWTLVATATVMVEMVGVVTKSMLSDVVQTVLTVKWFPNAEV